jgi:hypothetical protein
MTFLIKFFLIFNKNHCALEKEAKVFFFEKFTNSYDCHQKKKDEVYLPHPFLIIVIYINFQNRRNEYFLFLRLGRIAFYSPRWS